MPRFNFSHLDGRTGDLLHTEVVERKGTGHPDTICDEIAEEFSLELSRRYLSEFGQVQHHNVDKVLLSAGESAPRFGGGEIVRPMELFLAGRAIGKFQDKRLPIEEIADRIASYWFAENLPTVEPGRGLKIHALVHPGSADLIDLFARQTGGKPLANDTSCGVGYAPLSGLERIVYAVEQHLGMASQETHPGIGRDIKVMGVRQGGRVHLTVACALIDRFVPNLAAYVDAKRSIAALASRTTEDQGASIASVEVNTSDDINLGRVYLTVTGTSAESGDDGEAGRGNRINGLITPHRMMTIESVAGKNPVTHVGKLYNIVASLIAQRIVDELETVSDVRCLIVSQIGSPLDEPQMVDLSFRMRAMGSAEPRREIAAIVEDELAKIGALVRELTEGRLKIGRWPLRSQ